MPDESVAVQELVRLADRPTLEVNDYERLAMAVFGEMIAKDAAKTELWQRREGGLISFYAYVDGRKAIEGSRALDACWRRLRQDLYEGSRTAMSGVQCAYAYAKRSGLTRDPRWGGERRREVERILLRHDVDPNAPPGLRTQPLTPEENERARQPPPEYVAADVRSASLEKLPLHERLGIGDFWIGLSESERFLVNEILTGRTEEGKVAVLRELAGDKLATRADNRDIPPSNPAWVRDLPPQLGAVVDKLPARSRAILGAAYERTSRQNLQMLHQAVLGEMIDSNGRVGGERLLDVVMRQVVNRNDSIGAGLRWEMRLEQGTLSFPAYCQLRERELPKLAAREQQLAARHEVQRQREIVAAVQTIQADPGLKQIGERYALMYEVATRSEWQKTVATAKGFGGAAVDTVQGIVTLLTTDPRKTAAGVYHLAKNPQILIFALDDASVDTHKLAGAALFELATTAIGAGPATKVSQGTKVARLAAAAEDAAKAGKLRAARTLADAAEDATKRMKSAGENVGEAEQAVVRARQSIAKQDGDRPPGYNPDDAKPDAATPGEPGKPDAPVMRDNIKQRYRLVAFGGFLVEGTRHVFIQGTAEQVRRIHVRIRQLRRFPEGRKLIQEIDDALERTLQADVDADVAAAAKSWGWKDEAIIASERQRLHQQNRRNRRVVIKWTGEKGRIQCEAQLSDAAHRNDLLQEAGKGSGSVIHFDPDRWVHVADDGSELRPPTPAIALGHELVHAHRNASGRATRARHAEEMETIGLDDTPEWIGAGRTPTENELRQGWAKLQKKVAELRTDY
jgi:hypothetical protein